MRYDPNDDFPTTFKVIMKLSEIIEISSQQVICGCISDFIEDCYL